MSRRYINSTYTKFTNSELKLANSIDLATFLQSRGENLKRVGRDYKLIYTDETGTHDSIMIRGNKWYDHNNQEGGGTIKFLQRQYNLLFHEAVRELIGGGAGTELTPQYKTYSPPSEPPKEFKLPSANSNMRRVFAYLAKERHLDAEVLTHFSREKKIFEDSEYHNAVFVGYDENGEAKQAHKRSTMSFGKSFRQTVEGSDTRYSFNHIGTSNRVYVFEAPIDMLSFISLYKQNWKENNYITLNGTYENALINLLEKNHDINEIFLCTDNDEGGIDAVDRLTDILHEKNYKNIYRIAPEYNDWNECLKAQFGVETQPAVPHKRRELFYTTAENLNAVSFNAEKLSQTLWVLYKNGQYRELAEVSASACAHFSKLIKPDRDYSVCFADIKKCLVRDYRAYKDKGKIIAKDYELKRATQNILQDLKVNNTRTAVQLSETARLFYSAADNALRCAVETEMTVKPEITPQIREPTIHYDCPEIKIIVN